MIDDDENARLIIDPGVTSRASSSPLFYGDRKCPGYSAPEIFGFGETRTAGSDVYVMALVVYEVRSYQLIPSSASDKSHVNLPRS